MKTPELLKASTIQALVTLPDILRFIKGTILPLAFAEPHNKCVFLMSRSIEVRRKKLAVVLSKKQSWWQIKSV